MPTDPTNGDDPRASLDSESNADVATLALPARDSAAHEPDTTNMAKKIGRHVVLEQVGRGGMGSVYRAYDPKLQREVAWQESRKDVSRRREERREFTRMVQAQNKSKRW